MNQELRLLEVLGEEGLASGAYPTKVVVLSGTDAFDFSTHGEVLGGIDQISPDFGGIASTLVEQSVIQMR